MLYPLCNRKHWCRLSSTACKECAMSKQLSYICIWRVCHTQCWAVSFTTRPSKNMQAVSSDNFHYISWEELTYNPFTSPKSFKRQNRKLSHCVRCYDQDWETHGQLTGGGKRRCIILLPTYLINSIPPLCFLGNKFFITAPSWKTLH